MAAKVRQLGGSLRVEVVETRSRCGLSARLHLSLLPRQPGSSLGRGQARFRIDLEALAVLRHRLTPLLSLNLPTNGTYSAITVLQGRGRVSFVTETLRRDRSCTSAKPLRRLP